MWQWGRENCGKFLSWMNDQEEKVWKSQTHLLKYAEFPIPMKHLDGFFFCKQFYLLVPTYVP